MRSKAGGDRLRFIPFQLPTLVDEPPAGDGWLHEIKHDGYRTELIIEHGEVHAFTRRGLDWTEKPIVDAAAGLPAKAAIIDGEIVVLDDAGFQTSVGTARSAAARAAS